MGQQAAARVLAEAVQVYSGGNGPEDSVPGGPLAFDMADSALKLRKDMSTEGWKG